MTRDKINCEMAYQFKREPLNPREVDALCNACETFEEKLIIWTLLDTGLRVSELCNLTDQNILWQEKAIRVVGKGGPFGKKTKQRVVPLISERTRTLLERYFAIHKEWFVEVRMVQRIVKKVANRAKIARTVTPHVLRHTFACTAHQKGISLAALQKALGHDLISTTQIYLNLSNTHLVEEFEKKW
jgi:integrase/recombinase XerD